MFELSMEYTKCHIKELTRNYSAAFFTLFFPAILLQLFSHSSPSSTQASNMMIYIIYCNYAVQTVMLQALGITVSAARKNLFTDYIKTLPVSTLPSTVGRILSSLCFAFFSLSVVILVFYLNHLSDFSFKSHLIVCSCALLGGIPMAMIAIFLGNVLNPAASRSVFVLLNLLLLFGSYVLSDHGVIGLLRESIPSYQWLLFSTDTLTGKTPMYPLLWMLGYTVLFYLLTKVVTERKIL